MKFLFEKWRRYLVEEEELEAQEEQEEQIPAIVTFDFDSTLSLSPWDDEEDDWVYQGPHQELVDKLFAHSKEGSVVYIVTSRHREFQDEERRWYTQRSNATPPKKYIPDYQIAVWDFVKKVGLPIKDVIFTNGKIKADAEDGLIELGADLHYDDDPEEIAAAQKAGIKTVVSDPYGDYEDLKEM